MNQVIIVDTTDTQNIVKKNKQLKLTPKATVVLASDKEAVSEALTGKNEVYIFADKLDKRHINKDKVVKPKAKKKETAKPKAKKSK